MSRGRSFSSITKLKNNVMLWPKTFEQGSLESELSYMIVFVLGKEEIWIRICLNSW